mgnify:CR=1 FL=1
MWASNYWGNRYFAPRYWAKFGDDPGGAILVRRPNMMRTGSRGDWIFKTVN